MKYKINLMLALAVLFINLSVFCQEKGLAFGYPNTSRTVLMINEGWRFHLGDPDIAFFNEDFDDSSWEMVSVPHTLKLTSINLDGVKDDKTQPTFHRMVGWYRKNITVTHDPGKKVFLKFEGVHQVTDLWVNGEHVGQHSVGGYTPFIYDISSFVRYGAENQITVLADNRRRTDVPPDPGRFDYVKFSGLYRDVYLVETNSLRVTFNIEDSNAGITITTPSVDPVNMNATIDIKTVVRNDGDIPRIAVVLNRIIDRSGTVVLKLTDTATIEPGQNHQFNQIGGIEEDLHLWSTDDPYLYHVNTLVLESGTPIDAVNNTLGIRKFELDPTDGFKLNGKSIEPIGFNRHQHYGYIGDAMPNSLHYKDMLQFKQLGFNVVRTAHYPQDDALIKACDELGILVYEEAPSWISISQNPRWFENMEKAARTMVRNHRNHPSVVIWGAGINHRGYVPRIHYAIKQEDPFRLTASQNSRWTGWQSSGLTDIFANMNYGPGIWERQEPLFAMEGNYGPEVIAKYKRDPMLTGLISWTAHAYYTFHDIGNEEDRTRLGIFNSFRYPKDFSLWWYPSELTRLPMIYVDNQWTKEVKNMTIYSNCEEVELVVNEHVIGRYKPSNALKYQGLDHPPFEIKINSFEPGKLVANGYIQGKLEATQTLYTPQKASAIRLVVDTIGRTFIANGADILVAYAEVVDEHGMVIRDDDSLIKFSVKGDAHIVGNDAGIGANPLRVKDGAAPVLIRAGLQPGKIEITARAKGLDAASAEVNTVSEQVDMIFANAYPIYDFDEVKVDMGAADQLVQFGWKAWNGKDNESSVLVLESIDDAKAEISPFDGKGVLRWLGEMNVIGKNGYVYGEGVLGICDEGIALTFEGLKKGRYRLKTYHHAPVSNTNSMDPNIERLKNESIHTLPYAKFLKAEIHDAGKTRIISDVVVSQGKELQFEEPGQMVIDFSSDGMDPVKIIFKSKSEPNGVWLNGFELRHWK